MALLEVEHSKWWSVASCDTSSLYEVGICSRSHKERSQGDFTRPPICASITMVSMLAVEFIVNIGMGCLPLKG